jgi:hypothetical protein
MSQENFTRMKDALSKLGYNNVDPNALVEMADEADYRWSLLNYVGGWNTDWPDQPDSSKIREYLENAVIEGLEYAVENDPSGLNGVQSRHAGYAITELLEDCKTLNAHGLAAGPAARREPARGNAQTFNFGDAPASILGAGALRGFLDTPAPGPAQTLRTAIFRDGELRNFMNTLGNL